MRPHASEGTGPGFRGGGTRVSTARDMTSAGRTEATGEKRKEKIRVWTNEIKGFVKKKKKFKKRG
jgi:hypothetical protein